MNPDDKLSYIADLTRQLEAMAIEAGHPKLAYLLRLARSECDADPSAPPPPRVEEDTSGLPH